MLDQYPKEVTLQDGFTVTLRPMGKDDCNRLYRYFDKLSNFDKKYLRNDIQNRVLIEQWCRKLDYNKVLPILAIHQSKIIASATLHQEIRGWSKHIGEIRLTIAPEHQQRGLGSLLVQEISDLAQHAGLEKLMARVVVSRDYLIDHCEQSGFVYMTTLKRFVKSISDQRYQDIAVMVKELNPKEPSRSG